MGSRALYAVALICVVVAVDLMFFRHRFGARLAANVVIVLLFGAGYLVFVKRP